MEIYQTENKAKKHLQLSRVWKIYLEDIRISRDTFHFVSLKGKVSESLELSHLFIKAWDQYIILSFFQKHLDVVPLVRVQRNDICSYLSSYDK